MKQKKNEEASTSFVSMTGRYGGKARHLSKGQHLTAVSGHREASLVRRPIGDLIYGTTAGVLSLNSKAPGSAVVLTPRGRRIHGTGKGVNIWPGWITYPLRKSKSEVRASTYCFAPLAVKSLLLHELMNGPKQPQCCSRF